MIRMYAEVAFDGAMKGDLLVGDLAFEIRSSPLPDLLKARYVLILRYSIVRLVAEVAFDGATKGDLLFGNLAFEIRSSVLPDLLKARYVLIVRYWIVRLFLWSPMIIKNTQSLFTHWSF